MQRQHELASQLAPPALVGLSRIGKAVAKNDTSLLKRRRNHLGKRLRAISEHQPEFCARIENFRLRIKQQRANAITSLRPTRLTGDKRFLAAGLKPRSQTPQLCRLARAVEPLKG